MNLKWTDKDIKTGEMRVLLFGPANGSAAEFWTRLLLSSSSEKYWVKIFCKSKNVLQF